MELEAIFSRRYFVFLGYTKLLFKGLNLFDSGHVVCD